MKTLTGAIAATLIGIALLAVGVVGVSGAFDGDDDGSGSGSSSEEDDCRTADRRLTRFASFEVAGRSDTARVFITCEDGKPNASLVAQLAAEEPRVVALWLYRTRRDAELVGAKEQQPGDGNMVLGGAVPSGSEDYPKWLVTDEAAGDERPARPSKTILFRGPIR